MCATTSRVRQPSQSEGASQTAAPTPRADRLAAPYSSAGSGPEIVRSAGQYGVRCHRVVLVLPEHGVRRLHRSGARDGRQSARARSRSPSWTSGHESLWHVHLVDPQLRAVLAEPISSEDTRTPESTSVHDSRSGGLTSSYTARITYSLPSASFTMTVSNTPPGRASTTMRSSGVRTPSGPRSGSDVPARSGI